MRYNRKRIKVFVILVTVTMLLIASSWFAKTQRDAEAAATVYGVAQGYSEANFSHWSVGGIPSRGISRLKIQTGTATMDSSYATGGEVLDLSATFPNAVLVCLFATEQGYSFEYMPAALNAPATGLVKAYTGAGVEVAGAVDLAAYVVEYLAIGW